MIRYYNFTIYVDLEIIKFHNYTIYFHVFCISVTRFVNETATLHFKQTSTDGVTSKIACNLFDSKDEIVKNYNYLTN